MEQLFGAIPAILESIEPNAKAFEALVFAAWRRAAGDNLSSRTAPVAFHEKRLVVAVEDATWQRNLEDLAPPLLAKLNTALGGGTVKFIEFRIEPKSIHGR